MMSEEKLTKTVINWYPGHMAKARREMKENMNLIDVVYEVVDARIPISSKIIDIDDITKNKPRILIMTKYDMCDRKQTDLIAEFYKSKGIDVITVDLIKNINVSKIIEKTNVIANKLNEDRKKKGMKPRNIRALVVGAPNVGKSTLINRLVGKKKAITGDKPGVTKQLGWIRVGSNIELLDSPGILWPKLENQEYAYNMAAFSSIKEEILDIQELAIFILKKLDKLYPELLSERYGVSCVDEDIVITLDTIGKKRGALMVKAEVDYDKVYNIIIRDLKEGLIGKVTFDRLD